MDPQYNETKDKIYYPQDTQDGEIFTFIDNFQIYGIFRYYLISNYGRIFHIYENRYLNQTKNNNGYYTVSLKTKFGAKPFLVHRLVLECHGNLQHPIVPFYDWTERKLDVNHIDGNKSNNHIENLEWCTRRDNILHAYQNNLAPSGVNNTLSNIHDEGTVCRICQLIQEGCTNKDIVNIINDKSVTISVCQDIRSGHGYKEISKEYNFQRRPGKLFSDEMINNICKYFQYNTKPESITVNEYCRNALKYYNYDISNELVDSVRKIYNRKYYTRISKNYNF